MSGLSYEDSPRKISFSFGRGLWQSQLAFAFGAGYMSESGRIRSNISLTRAGDQWGIGARLEGNSELAINKFNH
ncbi:YadA-like family protein [Bartonella grahamii]|uniref:YadA-like family protein n=1 Tax=Bartonella grahamii TaxID=33045 RepID=UPI002E7BE639|nr:YadA-like family protein [Bartonella grahamii]